MLRPAAVAGRFYPGNPSTLAATVRDLLALDGERVRARGVVVPHAGYMYSGAVAGAVYSRIEIPSRTIILCPNHTGLGVPLSINRRGAWETPLGQVQVDSELADALIDCGRGVSSRAFLEDDTLAHRFEHAVEVQLPFLQSIRGTDLRFVPITVGVGDWDALQMLGQAIAEVVARIDPSILLIASSDMNHYEPDAPTRIKDAKAIEPMLRLDARGLHTTVERENVSMCGFGPATSMLVASRQLGATRGELVRYATSADVSKDYDRVVGYAGIIVA